MKRKYKFGHSYKANRHNLCVVVLEVPVDKNGKFDVLAQREISNAYATIEQYQKLALALYTNEGI